MKVTLTPDTHLLLFLTSSSSSLNPTLYSSHSLFPLHLPLFFKLPTSCFCSTVSLSLLFSVHHFLGIFPLQKTSHQPLSFLTFSFLLTSWSSSPCLIFLSYFFFTPGSSALHSPKPLPLPDLVVSFHYSPPSFLPTPIPHVLHLLLLLTLSHIFSSPSLFQHLYFLTVVLYVLSPPYPSCLHLLCKGAFGREEPVRTFGGSPLLFVCTSQYLSKFLESTFGGLC